MLVWVFSVFWDLYSAAPERRDQHPHSEEAKAFHDYVRSSSRSILIYWRMFRDLLIRMACLHR